MKRWSDGVMEWIGVDRSKKAAKGTSEREETR
jgi:hypothetical protein